MSTMCQVLYVHSLSIIVRENIITYFFLTDENTGIQRGSANCSVSPMVSAKGGIQCQVLSNYKACTYSTIHPTINSFFMIFQKEFKAL